jgi:two-component system sensor kinase FixL
MQAVSHKQRGIRVEASEQGGNIEIMIKDFGPGMDASVKRQLFQQFVTTKKDGMGLGLSICQAIVEAHGGDIALIDATIGTCFRISLPKHQFPHEQRQVAIATAG